MICRLHHASGVPIYLQLMEQVKYAIETGALRPGDQLPGIRKMAESLVINPNTVAKAYRELEHEGVIEVRHGSGAFISHSAGHRKIALRIHRAQPVAQSAISQLLAMGLSAGEVRRLVEAQLLEAAPTAADSRQ
jgi:GntR family transcriptional regulator